MSEMKDDPVNHPRHYTSHPSGVECIQIARHHNFNIGNAIKYLWRAGLKTASGDLRAKQIEDLEKARWYIADEIKRLSGEDTRVKKRRELEELGVKNLEAFKDEIYGPKSEGDKVRVYRVRTTSKSFPGKTGELVTDDFGAIDIWNTRGCPIVLRFPSEGLLCGFRPEEVDFLGYGNVWLEGGKE